MSTEKMEILERLGRGEITAQQAEEELNKLHPRKGFFKSLMDMDLSLNFCDSNAVILEEELRGSIQEGPITLDLSSANGSIRVETWESPEYCLTIQKRVRAGSREEAEELAQQYRLAEIDGNHIKAGDKEYRELHRKISLSLHLCIPAGHECTGTITTANGSISCTGLEGNKLELSSANGSVRLEDISGGPFQAKTVNGGIRIEGSTSEVAAKTTNGSVNLNSTLLCGNTRLETVNGSITAVFPASAETAFNLLASTTCGRVKIDHSQVGIRKIGGSGGKHIETRSSNWDQAAAKFDLELSTVNGSISIKETE